MLAVEWIGGITGHLRLIDQTRLPRELVYRDCQSAEDVWDAIKRLQVRGAPAIGIAAAYGLILGIRSPGKQIGEVGDYLKSSRPTAVNLAWAVNRMIKCSPNPSPIDLLNEAHAIWREDAAMCRAIGRHGAELIRDGDGVLTHCNTGGLATAEYGTALSAIFTAHDQGKRVHVYADETRPLLQGARLTTWELMQHGVPVTLICDNMAGVVMKSGKVQLVIVGADRIAANGDSANKIGTYGVAVLAKYHGIPFYIAAPSSTFDLSLPTGAGIPIEERSPEEVTSFAGTVAAPAGVGVFNPAFDVTSAELIAGLVTEKGLIQPVTAERIRAVLSAPAS